MEVTELGIISELLKDLRKAKTVLTDNEARYFVDLYYQMQDFRKATENQIRSMDQPVFFDTEGKKRAPTEQEVKDFVAEPHASISQIESIIETLEKRIATMLDIYTDGHPVGVWAKSVCGINRVIAAGLLAYIDITKCPTAGHIWSYAGLNPEQHWNKGEKRPFNAALKVLCWKIGHSFVLVSSNDKDVYGKIYKARKEYEQAKNEAGEYADQAAAKLEKFKIGKDTDAYKSYSVGKLPPAHIQQRAERYATKIFLSHLQQIWYKHQYGIDPPAPFAIAILGHAHKIEPRMPEAI